MASWHQGGERHLTGRVVVVTGAGAGIGRACALEFARAGAEVACVDVDRSGAEGTAKLVQDQGAEALVIEADAGSSRAVDSAAQQVRDTFDGVDILVNGAGGAAIGAVHETSDELWAEVLARNLTSTFLWSRTVIPDMLERGHGVIVNIASSLAVGGPRFAAYTAAKAGVRGLTAQMARDYGPTIRVNSVSPAAIDTPGLRSAIDAAPDPEAFEAEIVDANKIMRRLGTPEEVAAVVLFAASDQASFMTGQDLVVCGGQTVGAY